MKQLQTLIDKINADKNAAMTVHNLDETDPRARVVISNASRHKIENQYGSFEKFFETLHGNGITRVRIFERRSNGSSYLPVGQPFDWDMATDTETPAATTPTATAAQPFPATPDLSVPLAAPGLHAGLNALAYYQMDYPRLQGEHSAYRLENQQLKEKVAELKEELLRHEHSNTRAKGQQDLMVQLAGAAPPIIEALGALGLKIGGGPGQQAGLAGEQLTATQQEVFATLRQLDDDTLAILGDIPRNFGNAEFLAEFQEMLRKYNIIAAA